MNKANQSQYLNFIIQKEESLNLMKGGKTVDYFP